MLNLVTLLTTPIHSNLSGMKQLAKLLVVRWKHCYFLCHVLHLVNGKTGLQGCKITWITLQCLKSNSFFNQSGYVFHVGLSTTGSY